MIYVALDLASNFRYY